MTKSLRYTGLLFALLAVGGAVHGQRKDFQTWYEAGVDAGLGGGWDISAEIGQRLDHNSTRYDRTQLTLAAEYDFLKYLSAAGGVRFLTAADREQRIQTRYRIHGDLTAAVSLLEVDLSLRARFQYGFEEFVYFTDVSENNLVNRLRLKGDYHIFGTRFEVFGYVESWGLFGPADGRFFKRMRYSAGAGYTLGFRSELNLRYILEDEFNQVDPLQSHILVLGYSFSF